MSQNSDNQNGQSIVHEPEIINPDGSGPYGGRQDPGRFNNRVFASYMPVDAGGCLPFFISFSLFFICLGQFGVLAAIGFLFFHIIGSILGSVRGARMLMMGIPWNPWPWRVGNWIISFLLTAWLAGGFAQ